MSGYVLFGRNSASAGTRDKWLGSEANSQPSTTPGYGFRASAFNADTATAAGSVLAGPGAADYAGDGILLNANVAMFNFTETPTGVFATAAPADLDAKIVSNTALFGAANTDLDPARSDVDLPVGKLHLAQTEGDWNGIKNLEISVDSATSLRDIRLENFVDMRLKLGDEHPDPSAPQGAVFNVDMFNAKRGEVDASHSPQAIDLFIAVWSNSRLFQNSFDLRGSVFDDLVTIRPGLVGSNDQGPTYEYHGAFTSLFAALGAGDDRLDSQHRLGNLPSIDNSFDFAVAERVWGGSGDDVILTGGGSDRIFGDFGSGTSRRSDPVGVGGVAGNDVIDAGVGRDWIEGNGDRSGDFLPIGVNAIVNGSFEQFDTTPDSETVSHEGGKWFTFKEQTIDNVPGWGPINEEFAGPIELQTNAAGGLVAFDGLMKAEVESNPDFGEVVLYGFSQGFETVPNVTYHVSFAYAPSPDAPASSSTFLFTLTGSLGDESADDVQLFFENNEPGWHVFEADIIGSGPSFLSFANFDLDGRGALIDDVRVTPREPVVDLSQVGDDINCGNFFRAKPTSVLLPDGNADTVNFNVGDGFDVVRFFEPGLDRLRIANAGALSVEVVASTEGPGTLVQNAAGAVFLLGVTTPLGQTSDGGYLLLS